MVSLRTLVAAALAVVAGGPLTAGAQNRIQGSGKLPAGWNVRFDEPGAALVQVDVRQAGKALAFRTGPAAIYWNTRDVATGQYTVSAIFEQKKSMQHEAYGIFIGGKNLSDPTQNYLYMAIKPLDGTFLINHRNGNAAPRALMALTPSPAINREAAGTGAATNAIAIRVSRDSVHFYINGREVQTYAKSALGGVATEGIAGLRVNHNLDIEVREFGVSR